jgi:hypothetical protein
VPIDNKKKLRSAGNVSVQLMHIDHNVIAAMNVDDKKYQRKSKTLRLLHEAAAKLVAKEDPWGKRNIPAIPAERIIRHLYHPETGQWTEDETIVKVETEPFTHGAMRFCYRMKTGATSKVGHKSSLSQARMGKGL